MISVYSCVDVAFIYLAQNHHPITGYIHLDAATGSALLQSNAPKASLLVDILEDSFTSGIDRLIRYGQKPNGEWVGLFLADGEQYGFTVSTKGEITTALIDNPMLDSRFDATQNKVASKSQSSRKAPKCQKTTSFRCGASCQPKMNPNGKPRRCKHNASPEAQKKLDKLNKLATNPREVPKLKQQINQINRTQANHDETFPVVGYGYQEAILDNIPDGVNPDKWIPQQERLLKDQHINAVVERIGLSKKLAKQAVEGIYGWTENDSYTLREKSMKGEPDKRIDGINEYIKKAPKYKGELYRGANFKDENEYQKFLNEFKTGGETAAIGSFSSDLKIAGTYADAGGGDPGEIRVIVRVRNNKSGASVENLAYFGPGQKEVLVPKGVKYRLLSETTPKSKSGKTYRILDVEEIGND